MRTNDFEGLVIQSGAKPTPANTGKEGVDIDDKSIREQKTTRYSQNTKYRKYFSIWVMLIVPIWLLAVFSLLVLCGFGICQLSSTVLSTLLATTTANILGLAYIVLKGMFPQEKE